MRDTRGQLSLLMLINMLSALFVSEAQMLRRADLALICGTDPRNTVDHRENTLIMIHDVWRPLYSCKIFALVVAS